MKIDVVADKFNDLEKGLFAKLLDRSVLPLAGAFLALQCDETTSRLCLHTCIHAYMFRYTIMIYMFFSYIYTHINFHYRYRYVYIEIYTHSHGIYIYIYMV